MKRIIFILVFIGVLQMAFGQQELKRADAYFERAFYSDAIPLYEQLLPMNKNSRLIKNLSDSYYKTYNMKAAARWYSYLISNYGENVEETYHFRLNQSLKAIGKYDEAAQVLKEYHNNQGNTAKAAQLEQDILYLENISAIGPRFDIVNLNINTSTSEFGARQVDSNLVYSASRKNANGINKIYRWNNQNYLDFYTHPIDKLTLGDSLSSGLSKTINTKMHEGTFAITKDRKTIYFTRNNFNKGKKKTDADKITNLKIFKAEWVDEEWKNTIELPFNSDDFSTEHPALSKDETTLFFASDRPGGFGSFDLYTVTIQPNGFYGNPINLGELVNTAKKEQFPFVDREDVLYFSSNGHPGYGLLDVFMSKPKNGTYQKPDNLGLPVNSGYDDFSLVTNENGNTGFFSSNRPLGKGSDDIYSFTETKPLLIEDCKQFLEGILTDKTTKKPIPNGMVRLLDNTGELVEKVTTSENGSFIFPITCATSYTIKGSKTGYDNNSKIVVTTKERNKRHDGSLELFSLQEKENQRLLEEQKIKEKLILQKKKEEEVQILKEKNAKEKAKKERLQKIQKTIQSEEAIVKEKDRTLIKTEEIHFDYGLFYLRRETRERLAKLIEILKANPNMVIEIGTHTDIRGRSQYNKDLSQKRADSVREYLIKNGIAEHQVIAIGYGETNPIVKCPVEKDCTEEDHEWNRRCEFVIVKWE